MQTPSAAKTQRVKTPDILQAAARKRATTPPSVAVQNLARDDEDAWAAMAVANLRAGAQTPPTPMTPSAAGTPRSLPGFELDKEGQGTPPSPRSEGSEPIATPPSEDYNEDDRTDHLELSEQPTGGNTSGTMGWVAEVPALIPTKVEKARWVGASGYDDMRDIGDISGLTAEQIEARVALRTRQLLRTSRGECALSSDLNHMGELLKAFDSMVLMACRGTDDVEAILKSDAFWNQVDTLEKRMADREDSSTLVSKLHVEINQLDKEISKETERLESLLTQLHTMPEDDEEAHEAEIDLMRTVPSLRQSILMKRYAKYAIYAQGVVQVQREYELDPSKSLRFKEEGTEDEQVSAFAPGARALLKRTMRIDQVRKQRVAERDGALLPNGGRPADALNAHKLHFPGPVFGHQRSPSEVEDGSLDSRSADSSLDEEFIPGKRWIPPPLPELFPPPPNMPSRRDINEASWARPGFSAKDTSDRAKKKFFDAHLPKAKEGVPTPPTYPGAVRAPPQPGEDIPSHKLKVVGLPMNCTEDALLEWLGEHAQNVNQNYDNTKEGYKRGIAIYKGADGWLTGQGAIKFLSKPACLKAIAALDRRPMGSRVIYLDYVFEKAIPPRGRLMLVNVDPKTTSKDLQKWLRGWHLASEEDNQHPELLQDHEGFNTGEAILTFEDVESMDNCLSKFDWSQQLHGTTVGCYPTPPLKYDDVDETWIESNELANSTKKLLADNPHLDFINSRFESGLKKKRGSDSPLSKGRPL